METVLRMSGKMINTAEFYRITVKVRAAILEIKAAEAGSEYIFFFIGTAG